MLHVGPIMAIEFTKYPLSYHNSCIYTMFLSLEHVVDGFYVTNVTTMIMEAILAMEIFWTLMLFPRNWCLFMEMGLVYFKVVAWASLSKSNHNLFHSWLMFTTWYIKQFWLCKPSLFDLWSITLRWSCNYFTKKFPTLKEAFKIS